MMVFVCRLLATERQLSIARWLWVKGKWDGAVRVARLASSNSDVAKLVLAQWLLYPGVAARQVFSPTEGVSLLREAVSSGMPEAHQVLAGCYLNAEGVAPDLETAINLLETAGNKGLPSAWQELVHLFTSGKHTPPDYVRALRYAEELALAGFPEMQRALLAETLESENGVS